jgi:CheY-like chemotaxis protein
VRALRIVVADDWPDAAESLAILLRMYGHFVEVVHDGLHALDTARSSKVDVALLDAAMPKMSGLEAASILSSDIDKPLLICVSGYACNDDRAKALAAGFDHFFAKPVDIAAIVEILETMKAVSPAPREVRQGRRNRSASCLAVGR